jgi:glycosyltransferase involved in cell wall biosynthesis
VTRVALVLAASTGGIGRHVASLAAGLVRRGAEVTVIGPAATGERFDFGAGFVAVPVSAGPRAVPALHRALIAAGPDVVHAHGLRAGLVAGWARPHRRASPGAGVRPNRRAGVPLVVTWHNAVLAHGLRGAVHRLLERRVARLADVTLGASADLVARAVALGGRDVRPGAVAAPELAPPARPAAEVREELGLADGQPLLLSVGRLHPQKGYHVLIAAAACWRGRKPAPVVAIAGTGPAYLRLAALVSSARAPVLLLGHRDDVPDLLGAADLAIVTSRWEARQLFAQEALRAGVPLVGTDVGGLPELVGDAAVLVPPEDPDALDAAVTALLDDPARRADLAARGRERAATWPTEEQAIDRIQAVYAELTAQPAER